MDAEPVVSPSILFSDLTIREFGTDKISLIGTFSQFNAPRFPFLAPLFHVTVLLTNIKGPIESLPVTIRIEAEGSGHVIASTTGQIPLPATHTLADIAQLVFGIPPTQYQAPGRYDVHVLVRNEPIAKRPLFVKPVVSSTTTEKFES
jgi:hypothetical protein